MIKFPIFLIGLMGSGKSHAGNLLAQKYNCTYLDTDNWIEELYEKTITDIFTEEGEEFFRQAEKRCFEYIANFGAPLVVSCGGGFPCFNNLIEKMNEIGTTIFLNTDIDIICKRLWQQNQIQKRPLLQQIQTIEDLKEQLQTYFNNRVNIYNQAQFKVDDIEKFIFEI